MRQWARREIQHWLGLSLSPTPYWLGLSPFMKDCVGFLGKALYSHSASLYADVDTGKFGSANCRGGEGGGNPAMDQYSIHGDQISQN